MADMVRTALPACPGRSATMRGYIRKPCESVCIIMALYGSATPARVLRHRKMRAALQACAPGDMTAHDWSQSGCTEKVSDNVLIVCICRRWDMGKDGTEGSQRREPMGATALRLAKLITADRGLVALAAMFGVRHIVSCARACISPQQAKGQRAC